MMRFFTFILLAALAAAQNGCRSTNFQYCQSTLATNVGIDATKSSKMFTDYTVMYNWFLYKWGLTPGNTTNILNVCNSLEGFNGCMANDRGCTTVKALANSTDLNNAFFIDGTLNMYAFNCGPGINTLLHEGLSCSQMIIDGYQNYLQQCVETYRLSIVHDFNYGCTYVKNLMNCWSAPFGGSSGEVASPDCRRAGAADLWWACEANRVFTLLQFPNCGYSCDVQQQSLLIQEHLATHHKVENGVHFYKIPDYMDLVDGKVQKVEGKWMSN
ncbi:hypothetical protein Q1695_007795 [Nippostrongylus brasiliensis]|nr:hypothetical protein Q1695_007795 [Nippostrongylus brasiliensis]